MIVKTLEDALGTKGEAHGVKWNSMRLLHAEDGMGVTLTDCTLEAGFEMILWQKNHLEACYCLEGGGTVEEMNSGKVHQIRPRHEQPRPSSHPDHRTHARCLHLFPGPDRH